ncbi:MAG: hypothetical protein AB7S81_00830 [Bdellovibrionales bacterium]
MVFQLSQVIDRGASADEISECLFLFINHPDSHPNTHETMEVAGFTTFIISQRHGILAALETAKKMFDKAPLFIGLRWITALAQRSFIEYNFSSLPTERVEESLDAIYKATDKNLLFEPRCPTCVTFEENIPKKTKPIPIREGKERMTPHAFVKRFDP